ncbi:serine/threonine protein kinase [Hyalangium sp.]|uniref:serine/threonine protein kinase n=1 Tax=Hyalangium sp. TaxID=2028555 RepID=UPI002D30F607|nr:protein kinase [Hyalangium sp.]HYH94469.1 protein kinase [Hyalangium sp.]
MSEREDDKTHLSGKVEVASKLAPPMQIGPGSVLKDTYRIDAELGSGGMGTVYRATHLGLDKLMAVKVLSRRAVSTPDSLARFEREAKVAGKVSHPAMTAVIDFGVEQGTPYIVMEYVSGVELAELIERDGPMPPRRAVAVMRQIVSLLRAAHALGIVHRDLKPANVKVLQETPEDSQLFVKVLDFGVAKVVGDISGQLTSEGMLVGTPAYMAPEQITGQPIDGRTDLYSAGLLFHEMLSGKRAFKGETIARILHAQMNDPPPPLTVPVPDIVRQTLEKFCEKRPEDRFQDAGEADRALMACEDVLRPPSVNVAVGAALPASEELENGARTLTYRPKKAEPTAGTSGEPAPVAAESKPSSAVAVSPSLVTEGKVAQEEPALVPAPVPTPAPAPAAAPAPVRPSVPSSALPPHQTFEPRSSSGSSKAVALLGVAFVLVAAGIAGGVWAWKSARVATPSQPAEPPENESSTPQTGSSAFEGVGVAPEPGEEQGSAPSEPVAGADTPDTPTEETPGDEAPAEAEPEQEGSGEPQPAEEDATPPPSEEPEETCYVSVVTLESNKRSDGKYGPWLPKSVNSRETIDCSSVTAKKLNRKHQELFTKWPGSPGEKVLQSQTLSFEPKKKGAPDTQRVVVKVHTRVSE